MSLYIIIAVGIALFMALSIKYRLYDITLDNNKKNHKALMIFCVGIPLLVSAFIFVILSKKNLNYPYTYEISGYNAYEQLFDAFMKRQLNLDIKVDEIFSVMNNPYDRAERDLLGIQYPWDRVLFNNQYFSYFGIAPLILVYFPFYFITKQVPTAQTVCFILSVAAVIAIAMLTLKAIKIFCKKPNLLLTALSVLAVEFGSLLLMSQSSADMYYTPICSGILFLALFLLFTFSAYDTEKVGRRCVHFALSGISLSFLVMSRPNMALFFLIAVPVYIETIFTKKYKLSQKFKQVVSFAVPVIIGAVAVMWYNYARFGSVLEFGAKYQLTVYDVSQYHFSAALILPSFYYYFLQLPHFSTTTPHLVILFSKPLTYTGYLYATKTIGMFSFPSALGLVLTPAALKNKSRTLKAVLLIAVASCVLLGYFDICYGGINIRYLADIALVTMLFSSVMITDFYSCFTKSTTAKKQIVFFIYSLLLIASVIIGTMLIFSNERNNIINFFTNSN